MTAGKGRRGGEGGEVREGAGARSEEEEQINILTKILTNTTQSPSDENLSI